MALTAERVAAIATATPRRVAHAAHRIGYDRWTPPSALAVCVAVALVDEHGRGRYGDYRSVRAPARACADTWGPKRRPAFCIVAAAGFAVLCDPADFDLVVHVGDPFAVYSVVVLGPYIDAIEAVS